MENHGDQHHFTVAGTDIEAVKRENARAGMSYNEVKKLLAKTTGGHGTSVYSDTNVDEVRRKLNSQGKNK